MFRWRWVLVWLLVLANAAAVTFAQNNGFDPHLTLLGLSQQVEIGQPIEWVLTASNSGAASGDDVILTTTFGVGLRVDMVQSAGTITQDGRTVAVQLGDMASGANVQLTIFTTVIDPNAASASTCMAAANLDGQICATSLAVQALPATGETPFWRRPLLLVGMVTVSASMLVIGLGLMGLRGLQES